MRNTIFCAMSTNDGKRFADAQFDISGTLPNDLATG
jgi:hypothetical protein